MVSFWGESYRTRDNYVGFYGRYIHSYLGLKANNTRWGPSAPVGPGAERQKSRVIWVPGNLTISGLETMANEFPIYLHNCIYLIINKGSFP